MNSVSRFALGVTLALGGLGAAAISPAAAQKESAATTQQERAALLAVQNALQIRDYPAAQSALASAQAAATTSDGRYYVAALQMRLATETNNAALQASAIEALLASGRVPQADLPELYKSQGVLALQGGQYKRGEASFTRWAELAPNDPDALLALAEVKHILKKVPEALTLIDRAIELRRASGQPVPQSWYKRGLKQAFDSRNQALSTKFSRYLIAAYPSRENWRDVILVHRDLQAPDPATRLDLMRLMRATKSLAGERDYMELATALNEAGHGGEAKAVLDEGAAMKMIDPAKAASKSLITAAAKRAATEKAGLKKLQTAAMSAATGESGLKAGDAYLSAGDYAGAADLYRAAIQKGGVDASVANTRLGIALAMAGRKPEAQATLQTVNGTRTDVAALWQLWLAQQA